MLADTDILRIISQKLGNTFLILLVADVHGLTYWKKIIA
jgi:hypothetical protein